jgi:hypothetical protein
MEKRRVNSLFEMANSVNARCGHFEFLPVHRFGTAPNHLGPFAIIRDP